MNGRIRTLTRNTAIKFRGEFGEPVLSREIWGKRVHYGVAVGYLKEPPSS